MHWVQFAVSPQNILKEHSVVFIMCLEATWWEARWRDIEGYMLKLLKATQMLPAKSDSTLMLWCRLTVEFLLWVLATWIHSWPDANKLQSLQGLCRIAVQMGLLAHAQDCFHAPYRDSEQTLPLFRVVEGVVWVGVGWGMFRGMPLLFLAACNFFSLVFVPEKQPENVPVERAAALRGKLRPSRS